MINCLFQFTVFQTFILRKTVEGLALSFNFHTTHRVTISSIRVYRYVF